jgi:TPR repeat protein
MRETGLGVPKDYRQAAAWYRKSAEQGNVNAQLSLGNLYFEGKHVPQDYEQALVWFRKAADNGNAPAQYNLGLMYYKGMEFRRVIGNLQRGFERRPIEESPMHNSISGPCTQRAKVCRKTSLRLTCG